MHILASFPGNVIYIYMRISLFAFAWKLYLFICMYKMCYQINVFIHSYLQSREIKVAGSAIVSVDFFYFCCHVALTNIDINMRTTKKP